MDIDNNNISLETDNLIPRLVDEFGYSEKSANRVIKNLKNCSERIKLDFLRWWNTGVLPDLEIEQYNVSRLKKEFGMNPIAALLTLDWLLKEPEEARASLKRGYDKII